MIPLIEGENEKKISIMSGNEAETKENQYPCTLIIAKLAEGDVDIASSHLTPRSTQRYVQFSSRNE